MSGVGDRKFPIVIDPLFIQVSGRPLPESEEESATEWRNVLRGAYPRVFINGEAFALEGCYPNRPPSNIVAPLVSVHTVLRRKRDGALFGVRWYEGQDTVYGCSGDIFTDESQILQPVASVIMEKRPGEWSMYDTRITL